MSHLLSPFFFSFNETTPRALNSLRYRNILRNWNWIGHFLKAFRRKLYLMANSVTIKHLTIKYLLPFCLDRNKLGVLSNLPNPPQKQRVYISNITTVRSVCNFMDILLKKHLCQPSLQGLIWKGKSVDTFMMFFRDGSYRTVLVSKKDVLAFVTHRISRFCVLFKGLFFFFVFLYLRLGQNEPEMCRLYLKWKKKIMKLGVVVFFQLIFVCMLTLVTDSVFFRVTMGSEYFTACNAAHVLMVCLCSFVPGYTLNKPFLLAMTHIFISNQLT